MTADRDSQTPDILMPGTAYESLGAFAEAGRPRQGIPVTVMAGDGIGPEVVAAARRVIEAVGVQIDWQECVAGATAFRAGLKTGVPEETIVSLTETGVALKGPLETPVGHGEKSANVTLRKLFEMYGNVRPARELPGISTPFSGRGVDLVIVRENVEDLYAGIEHMQTPSVAQCLKLISRMGCEKIVRLAFEYARAEGRRAVHCATKANIMKLTEGMMKRTFEEVAQEYPEIAAHHIIVDNCAHQLVIAPEQFDVIVTTNMNGDILSDLTSGLVGGLGLAPSANLGDRVAMFEAVHGSAPTIAGQDIANPTAMILSSVMMLRHIGHIVAADQIQRAVALTIEEGRNLTGDIAAGRETGTTTSFTDTVIANLERVESAPAEQSSAPRRQMQLPTLTDEQRIVRPASREVIGVDIFIEAEGSARDVGMQVEALAEGSSLRLKMMSNRGTQAYPTSASRMDVVDHWRCRFVMRDEASGELDDQVIRDMLQRLEARLRWNHVEKLYRFDGERAYSLAQGEE